MSFVALDLSAVFEMVNHEVLLQTLNSEFGISGTALKWFANYLQPGSFQVLINKSYSKEIDLRYSVPQGSAAGANIFNLYCSTLQEVAPQDLHLSGFADDHSICKQFKASDCEAEWDVKQKLEECMFTIKIWMDQVKLKMNPAKTEFIYFGNQVQLNKCMVENIKVDDELVVKNNTHQILRSVAGLKPHI